MTLFLAVTLGLTDPFPWLPSEPVCNQQLMRATKVRIFWNNEVNRLDQTGKNLGGTAKHNLNPSLDIAKQNLILAKKSAEYWYDAHWARYFSLYDSVLPGNRQKKREDHALKTLNK